MMVDAAYEELYRYLKPGIRENDCVGLVADTLYKLGSEHVEGVNAISGERCSPHPHNFTDRHLRPGDPAYFDILHSFNGYRTCYDRTLAVGSASTATVDAYKRCRDYLDEAISRVRPGVTTAEVAEVLPRAEEFGFANEEDCFALQLGHGVGLSIWEKPAGLPRPPRGHRGEHGLRAGDLLACQGRLVRGSNRGAAGRDQGQLRGHHALPCRDAARLRRSIPDCRRTSGADPRTGLEPQPGPGPDYEVNEK
jgi:Xaa-Pro aminopeptidase